MDRGLSDMVTDQINFSSVIHSFLWKVIGQDDWRENDLFGPASILVGHCLMTHRYLSPCFNLEDPSGGYKEVNSNKVTYYNKISFFFSRTAQNLILLQVTQPLIVSLPQK